MIRDASADRTTIEFPARGGYRSVGKLVLGGIASRFELPIDRVDDLLLAAESVLLQEPAGDTIRVEAEATASGLSIRVGAFAPGQLSDPGLRRVLDPLVDEILEHDDPDGATVELVVTAAYRAAAR